MREERGQVAGDVIVYEKFELWGSVGGDVKVMEGGKLYLRGAVYGNLIVEPGGRVHIYGQIKGDVRMSQNTKVIHSGVVAGDIVNNGGRLYVERKSKVGGKVKTRHRGDTKYEQEPAAQPADRPDEHERKVHKLD